MPLSKKVTSKTINYPQLTMNSQHLFHYIVTTFITHVVGMEIKGLSNEILLATRNNLRVPSTMYKNFSMDCFYTPFDDLTFC